jgi:hypothetical protein
MSVDLGKVILVLSSIEQPPGLRSEPRPGDLKGEFDQWFDGGAIKHITGYSEYHYTDGTLAVVPVVPVLNVEIRLPSGECVTVSEQP